MAADKPRPLLKNYLSRAFKKIFIMIFFCIILALSKSYLLERRCAEERVEEPRNISEKYGDRAKNSNKKTVYVHSM